MKNKIQRYLAGEREGFSLVELIIVIAIMAILVGVVALAVLPNIAKSRESKDLSTMDSICSALNAAVASTQASGNDVFPVPTAAVTITSSSTESQKVQAAVYENLGSGAKELTCSAADGATIYCNYNVSKKVIEVVACTTAPTADSTTGAIPDASIVNFEYNDKAEMRVTN
jgi:type IV pilus assembly protein PilA